TNPFERETPFRQSISEKRRLNQQPNNQAIQWKQRSFQDNRTNSERRQADQLLPDSSSNVIRSTSYESIHRTTEDDERKRQAKLRNRACNDSFRQAVDKSYCQNNHNHDHSTNVDKSNKTDKQRFKFSNLFTTKSKRKENQDEKSTSNQTTKTILIHSQSPSHDNQTIFYPPPPTPFSSRQDQISSTNKSIKHQNNERSSTNCTYLINNQQQGYQPYRFDVNQISHNQQNLGQFIPTHHELQIISGRSSLSTNLQKSSHLPIPQQFLQTNINGTQSLKHHHMISRSPYPSTFSVQTNHLNSHNHNNKDISINTSQRTGYTISSRSYLQFENPANV
ncbi:unnamed protein product, partial [Rotaria sp. Silwood1]